MLRLFHISNIALVSKLVLEFDQGLNLLTGETGSGKSIIVDALGVLLGARFTSELIKAGQTDAFIEGSFSVEPNPEMEEALGAAGINVGRGADEDLLIRRELSTNGRNRIFINHQLSTLSFLRSLRPFLLDIHGQGDQQTLFNPETHRELLDAYANLTELTEEVGQRYRKLIALNRQLEGLNQNEAEKLQLIDTLSFQIEELERARLATGEDEKLEADRRRLSNSEKLSHICAEAYDKVYEGQDSTIARISQAIKQVEALSEYELNFSEYQEGLTSAQALLEDLAFSIRDFAERLEFSPAQLEEIENRLVELARLKRKYGGSIESALAHLERSKDRLRAVERSADRRDELQKEVQAARVEYLASALELHARRLDAAEEFQARVVEHLNEVAIDRAGFEVRIEAPSEQELNEADGTGKFMSYGIDRVEFYFSANQGEPVRPLAKVASGGESSRLMLVLKSVSTPAKFPRTIVFDEIDTGIGGRVSEAVGSKLKRLSQTNQVLCVTHQPQIARFANHHFLVRKEVIKDRTEVIVESLNHRARIEEIARMLTGANITETARRHAREMLKG